MAAQKKSSINLLTAQIQPQGQWDRIYAWTLNTAKYVIIISELIVIAAIGYRFILDGKISQLDASILTQSNIREGREEEEDKMRTLISSISSIEEMEVARYSLSEKYLQIQSLIPSGIVVRTLTIDAQGSSISGQAASYNSLLYLEENLKNKKSLVENVKLSTSQAGGDNINFSVNFNLVFNEE